MTKKEAINLLGVGSNYTKKELRNSYIKKLEEANELKINDLKKAYEILRVTTYENKILIGKTIYCINYTNKLLNDLNKSFISKEDKEILIYQFSNYKMSEYAKTVLCKSNDVYEIIIEQCNFYRYMLYEKMIDLVKEKLRLTIKFNKEIVKFSYNQLIDYIQDQIYKKYIKFSVEQIIQIYEFRAGYNVLEFKINEMKNIALTNARNIVANENMLKNYDLILTNLDNEIKKLFKNYFAYVGKFNQLFKVLSSINCNELKIELDKYLNEFKCSMDFNQAKINLGKIKNKIICKFLNKPFEQIPFYEFKSEILKECDLDITDEYFILKKYNYIVGAYFFKTDTLNVFLNDSRQGYGKLNILVLYNEKNKGKYKIYDVENDSNYKIEVYDYCKNSNTLVGTDTIFDKREIGCIGYANYEDSKYRIDHGFEKSILESITLPDCKITQNLESIDYNSKLSESKVLNLSEQFSYRFIYRMY